MNKPSRRLRLAPTLRPNAGLKWAARKVLALTGWRLEGAPPPIPKFVVIGAYHTSHWDAMLMIAAGLAWGIKFYWMGKAALFNRPWGGILRWFGGVAIQRNVQANTVQQVVELFNSHSDFVLIISPEGTLDQTRYWKTGFYYIAHQSQVPVILAFLDYRRKVIGLGPDPLIPTGDIGQDFKIISDFYAPITPRFPQRKGLIAVEPDQRLE